MDITHEPFCAGSHPTEHPCNCRCSHCPTPWDEFMPHPSTCFCRQCRGETTTAVYCSMCMDSGEPCACNNGQTKPLKGDNQPMGLLSKIEPRERSAGFERRPFLDVKEHFPKNGELPFKIEKLRPAPKGMFSNFLLDVKCGKNPYTVGLKDDSVLLSQLMEEYGANEERWKGKTGTFVIAKGKYINLANNAKASRNGKRRK